MVVLSCFDGMSCGRIALDKAGIKVDKYYASEIDKYAQIVSAANYPDIVRLGDITKWSEWSIEQPDIIMGGSPCQGFSFAGKQLNFDDERSKLFFVFVDILKHYKPKYFLLENVIMSKESNDVISRILGELYPEGVIQTELFSTGRLEPIEINSALVSAQNRRRLYWTNIKGVEQPKDKGILLKDIIENASADKDKSYCIDASYYKGGSKEYSDLKGRRQMVMTSPQGRNIIIPENIEIPFMLTECRTEKCKESRREARIKTGKDTTKRAGSEYKEYRPNESRKANCITTGVGDMLSSVFIATEVQKDNVLVTTCKQIGKANLKGHDYVRRVYSPEGKSPNLCTGTGGNHEPKISEDNITWRKLTPVECERLQTVPDNFTAHVSNTQRYKMLGNGWTVDVIAHILSYIKQ